MHYNTLLFDLDGTVSDPQEGISRSINHALRTNGCPETPENELTKFIGQPLDDIFATIIGDATPSMIAACVSAYREHYGQVGYAENYLYDGIVESLSQLHQAGKQLGVCTSKRKDFAEPTVAYFELSPLFAFISGGDIGISKTQQIKTLLNTHTIDHNAIMIGDRNVDVTAAKANDLDSAGVLWGHGTREELKQADPTFLLERPKDLLRLISK